MVKETSFDPSRPGIIEQMRRIPTLSGLSERQIAEAVGLSRLRKYEAGEVVLREGTCDQWLYFLIRGELGVALRGVTVGELSRFGEMFGEMGLIDGSPRSATVTAVTPALCLGLDASLFDRLPEADRLALKDALNKTMCENMAARLREMDRKLAGSRPEA